MKWMVRTDIEGASGVVSYSQAEATGSEYEAGQRYFLSDFDALLQGLQGDEIHVYDEHFYGRNIPLDRLPEGVILHYGKPPYRADWAGGLDASFDGLIMLGFHSKAGTPHALLPHSYELDNADIRVNGLSVGEIGVETMIAGELGVPLVLVTGDDAGNREAEALVPGVATVTVKKGQSMYGAEVYALSQTAQWIADAARKLSAGEIKRPAPYAPPKISFQEIILEITLADNAYRAAFAELFPDVYRAGTVTIEERTLCAAWAAYWQMKLGTQAEMRK